MDIKITLDKDGDLVISGDGGEDHALYVYSPDREDLINLIAQISGLFHKLSDDRDFEDRAKARLAAANERSDRVRDSYNYPG